MALSVLGVLTVVLGYAVLEKGGVWPSDWNLSLLGLSLVALLFWVRRPRTSRPPRLNAALKWTVLLLPCYVAFQIIPLPRSVLHILSPARADLLHALDPVVSGGAFAAFSVVPALTFSYLLSIAAYALTFLLVREIASQSSRRHWLLTFPIIGIAAFEAALGLVQYHSGTVDNAFARGTYANRNHFAGLLEMALPFAVLYPVAVLRRVDSRHHSPAGPALKACLGIGFAGLIFVGIIHSLSRMGFLACLASLFLIGAIAFGPGFPGEKKQLAVVLAALLVVSAFVVLSPGRLVSRFAELAANEEISTDTRRLIWAETVPMIAAYPAFGCGLGGFESTFHKYQLTAPLATINFAHNDYLQLLAELGMVGFLIAAVLMIAIYAKAVRGVIRIPDPNGRYLALACLGSLTAILLHSMADFNLYIPANAMVVAWIAGLSTSR